MFGRVHLNRKILPCIDQFNEQREVVEFFCAQAQTMGKRRNMEVFTSLASLAVPSYSIVYHIVMGVHYPVGLVGAKAGSVDIDGGFSNRA